VLKQYLDRDPTIGLVLTCDTGISAHPAARLARERGVQMVDQRPPHLPATLPPVEAIVNPHLLSAGHPPRHAGVGWLICLPQLHCLAGDARASESYLEPGGNSHRGRLPGPGGYSLPVAVRTARLRNPTRLGLKVMMELAGIELATLSEEHLGYMLTPRLNAIGPAW